MKMVTPTAGGTGSFLVGELRSCIPWGERKKGGREREEVRERGSEGGR